ncbi:MAG: glycosyltransferase [Hydrogenophilales bacterium]|nr:glycosyltransferase [Hydrogenophilales bacterium]
MTDAQVSVIMPARNGERYIESALRSLLRERALGLDIIVVDDASTDGTAAIVRCIAASNPGVRLLDGPGQGSRRHATSASRRSRPSDPTSHSSTVTTSTFPAGSAVNWLFCKAIRKYAASPG